MITTKNVITIDAAVYRQRSAKLSHEAKGFWLDLLAVQGDGASLPACEHELGKLVGCDVRKVRRLKTELVKRGILVGRFGLKGAA